MTYYDPAPYQSAYGYTAYVPSAYGQPAYGETPYGQAPYGQEPYGQTPYDQTAYGQTAYGQMPYGQMAYGQTAYGQTAYGQTAYGQTAYESATSSTYRPTATAKDEKNDHRSFAAAATVVCATIVFFVSLCALIVLFALNSVADSSYTTAAGGTAAFGTNAMQGGDVVVVVETVNTPARTVATTEEPTASTAAPAEKIDDRPLVCTMGARLNSTQMFPPDGLCEYIFFDSLHKDGRNPLNAPERYDTNLQTFISAAQMHRITAFGIGISYDVSHSLEVFLNNSIGSFKPLKPFWDHSIYHFGILDTATVNPRESDILPALGCLKLLRDHYSQEIIGQGIKVFTFFAASAPNHAWATFYIAKFMNFFAPDLFIGLGHYPRGDNTLPGCFIVPPTLLQKPREIGNSYQHDFTTAFESFPRLSMSTLTLKYALSVTMKGRLAVPKVPTQYGFFTPCITNQSIDSFASLTDVCKNPNFRSTRTYEPIVDATQIRHVTEPTVFSYDDRVGLCRKLCTVQAVDPSVKFGIAVFDLDYADFSNTCGSKDGPFSRLHLLRSVLNFFRTRYKTEADTEDCVSLAT